MSEYREKRALPGESPCSWDKLHLYHRDKGLLRQVQQWRSSPSVQGEHKASSCRALSHQKLYSTTPAHITTPRGAPLVRHADLRVQSERLSASFGTCLADFQLEIIKFLRNFTGSQHLCHNFMNEAVQDSAAYVIFLPNFWLYICHYRG